MATSRVTPTRSRGAASTHRFGKAKPRRAVDLLARASKEYGDFEDRIAALTKS